MSRARIGVGLLATVGRRVRGVGGAGGDGRRQRGRRERGSMSLEMVLLTPALVACILAITAGARYVDARGQTSAAAYAAARAASLTASASAGVAAGRAAANLSMADRGRACTRLSVRLDAAEFRPGGDVRATVTCVADLSDLVGFGLPGSKSFTATAVVPIEEHRVM